MKDGEMVKREKKMSGYHMGVEHTASGQIQPMESLYLDCQTDGVVGGWLTTEWQPVAQA